MVDKIKADLISKMYYEDIHKYCYTRLKNNFDDADDVTQDVFLLFQIKSPDLEDKNLRAWLFSTACRKCKEYMRKRGNELNYVPVEEYDIEDETANICELLEECDSFDIEKIDQYREIVFKHLTEREKIIYQKHFIEGKSNIQIAAEMNTNRKNIGVMISRLNKKLDALELLVLCSFGQFILKLFF